MADNASEQEPSIEEILASIRQIISDDDEKDAPEETVSQAKPEPVPVVQQKEPETVPQEEPEVIFDQPEPVEEDVDDDVLELTEMVEDENSIEIDLQEHEEEPQEVEMQPVPLHIEDEILTETAKAATVASMAKLAANMPITRHRDHGNITLEDLVREMLHPMLKDWLSDNLPPMVERIVQKELEKLARKAQDV